MIRVPFIVLFISILLTYLSINIYSVERVDQQREQVRHRDRELLQLEKKRRNITEDESIFIKELNELEQRMHSLDQDIYKHNRMIALTQRRIQMLQRELKANQQKIAHRLRDIYLQRDTSHVMGATSLQDFVARLTHVLNVMKSDQNGLMHFHETSAQLFHLQKQLKVQVENSLHKRKQAQGMLHTLQEKRIKNKAVLASLTTKVEQLEKENEKQQTQAFELIKDSIDKARNEEIKQGVFTSDGPFYWPVDGAPITSTFGYRFDPVLREHRLHRGLDIGGALGAPIKAAMAGRVIECRPSNGYGYIVVLYHGKGLSTLYAHMYGWTVTVKVGDSVHKGQVIAHVGSNGWSTGPHLHFEVIEGGQAKNPIGYFAKNR